MQPRPTTHHARLAGLHINVATLLGKGATAQQAEQAQKSESQGPHSENNAQQKTVSAVARSEVFPQGRRPQKRRIDPAGSCRLRKLISDSRSRDSCREVVPRVLISTFVTLLADLADSM